MNTRYVDLLNEQQGHLDENYNLAHDVLDILDELTDENKSDKERIELLKALKNDREELFRSLVNLRVNSLNCIESYNTMMKIGLSSDIAKSKLKVSPIDTDAPYNMYTYLEELRELNIAWSKHLNLLNKFSIDMSYPMVNSDNSGSIAVNKQCIPKELGNIIELYDRYGDEMEDTLKLRANLMQYFENIRSTKVKYHLENKYLIANSLNQLTKSVAAWSQKWEVLESSLFGDNSNSICKLLQSVQAVKTTLLSDGDVNVTID